MNASAGRVAWVVGRGGLLGRALEQALRRSNARLFVPDGRFSWRDPDRLLPQLRVAVDRFVASAAGADRWEIHWAAGVGTMGSTEAMLVTETQALATLLDAVAASSLRGSAGRFAFASTAGAIYAGTGDAVIDERSPERPTTPYAFAKLAQEGLVRDRAARGGSTVLIARISTLYGVGQSSEKQQGLLTHIARCVIRNEPVRIFVPLDTIRDYIGVDEAAAMILDALGKVEPGRTTLKIVASEQPVTISEIVSIFKRIARRPPRIVTSGSTASSRYIRRIQFRSVVAPVRSRPPASLLTGIGQVLAAERMRHAVGARPASAS